VNLRLESNILEHSHLKGKKIINQRKLLCTMYSLKPFCSATALPILPIIYRHSCTYDAKRINVHCLEQLACQVPTSYSILHTVFHPPKTGDVSRDEVVRKEGARKERTPPCKYMYLAYGKKSTLRTDRPSFNCLFTETCQTTALISGIPISFHDYTRDASGQPASGSR